MKKSVLFSIILLIFLSLLGSSCEFNPFGAQSTPTATLPPASSKKTGGGGQVVAEGEVVPVRSVTQTFTINGILSEVLVKEGEKVKANQVLARLDGQEKFKSAVTATESELLDAQKSLDDLHKNADVNRASLHLAVAEAETTLKNAKDNLLSKDLQAGTQQQTDNAYAEYIVAKERAKDLEEDFNDLYANKPEYDYGRASAYYQLALAKEQRDKAKERWEDLKNKPDKYKVSVSEANVILAEATLKKAQDDLRSLKDGINADALELAQSRLKNAKAQLDAAKKTLTDSELRAAFDGVVISNSLKVGESVSPGVGTIVLADNTAWEVETTDLTELEVVSIKEGSPAKVAFDALPDIELIGKVKRIQNLGVNKQGDITYKVIISLDKTDDRLLWKMTAFVTFGG